MSRAALIKNIMPVVFCHTEMKVSLVNISEAYYMAMLV